MLYSLVNQATDQSVPTIRKPDQSREINSEYHDYKKFMDESPSITETTNLVDRRLQTLTSEISRHDFGTYGAREMLLVTEPVVSPTVVSLTFGCR